MSWEFFCGGGVFLLSKACIRDYLSAKKWNAGVVHWGRVGDKCTIFLCFVSLKIPNVGNRSLGRSKALAVRADGRFRRPGKAGVASGANDGAIGFQRFAEFLGPKSRNF